MDEKDFSELEELFPGEDAPQSEAPKKEPGRFSSGVTQSRGRFESHQPSTGRFEAPEAPEEPAFLSPDVPEEAEPVPVPMPFFPEEAPEDGIPAPQGYFPEVFEEAPAQPEEETTVPADISEEVIPEENIEEMPEESTAGVEPLDLSILEGIDLTPETSEAPSDSLPAPAEETAPEEPLPAKTKKTKAPKKEPVRKGRPKHKKGEGLFGIPNILVTCVWLALTLVIGVTLGRMVWICASDVLAFGREDKNVSITVYESDTIEQITDKLYQGGLIRYPGLFKLYASFAVDEGEIHPGMWDLNTRYDYHALVRMMSPSSTREVIKVLIPEGYSCRQIFNVLEENKVCTRQDIEAYAAYGELNDYWFLENVERGDKYCLEGFLFPDTYEFYQNDSPRNILNKMLNNFNNRFDEEMRWQIDQLNAHLTDLMRANGRNDEYVASHIFTVRDVVNVAAMVERETSSAEEGHTIASVIYNRLFNWGSTPAYLNIDATIVYALNGKNDLTLEDLKVDSPYNTYLYTGLTPGPIANPGLSSLKAALTPASTDYYYYILDPSVGHHHFSRTQEEHEAFRTGLGG